MPSIAAFAGVLASSRIGVIHVIVPMILLLDNYDSFVFNLARYFERLGQTTLVVRSDAIDASGVRELNPAAIVLSPGPCTPREAGNSLEIVKQLHLQYPLLGVCLGHQTIAEALGGSVVRATTPVHGRTSLLVHDGRGVFSGLPNPLEACRYHSLVVEDQSLPACLEVSARTEDGLIMAMRRREYPVVGVQFHPESILTKHGFDLLNNFLLLSGLLVEDRLASLSNELFELPARPTPPQKSPVTF